MCVCVFNYYEYDAATVIIDHRHILERVDDNTHITFISIGNHTM